MDSQSQSLLNDSVEEYTDTQRPPNLYPPLLFHQPVAAINPTMGMRKDSEEVAVVQVPEVVQVQEVVNDMEEEEDEEMLECQQFLKANGKTIPAPTEFADLEIVGLHVNTSGRYCSVHSCCGKTVVSGDCLRLVRSIVFINGKNEDAVKLVKICDGVETCTVAFVPKVWINLKKVKRNIGHFAVVKELYHESTSSFKREKSKRNCGMASVYFLNEVDTNK